MINAIEANLTDLFIHYIGNYQEMNGVTLSEGAVSLDESSHDLLLKYFTAGIKQPKYYHFTFSDGNHEMNPLFMYVRTIFENRESMGDLSGKIAQYLYDHSRHPQIKTGDLMVGYIEDLMIDDELLDAIILFKSENKDAFISLDRIGKSYQVADQYGVNIGKLDKACIIFNTEEEDGFKVIATDRTNFGKDARFWINDFLNLRPRSDDYHHTTNVIKLTKSFIKDRLTPQYDIDKTDEASILNKSKEYLKHQETFESEEYEQYLFKDQRFQDEFQDYKREYKETREVELADTFAVSQEAFKNQSKVFKSVLKLDKNFHVYIHGDRSKIQKGTDNDGRKYYILYYDKEN